MTFTLLNAAAQAAAPVEATGVFSWAWLMIAIPAASSALLLVLGRRSDRWGHLLATLASWAAFAVGVAVIATMLSLPAQGQRIALPLFSWIPAGDFSVDFGLMLDPLSMTFVMLVTFVGSLIHAATMVTAGVYLIVRSGAIFQASPIAATAVVIVGAITLLFGAIVGCAKDDMKKVLAASTMSQIGYMMLGAGLGPIGWAFAIFHLFTHGFFKALMFLGAGSVMHGMNDQVNMRRFGALRTAMKVTWITFAFGWLAILGVPPFSGFFSKDKIIEAAFGATTFAGHEAVWAGWVFGIVTMVGAGITAFYMSRLFFMTFHGTARWTTEAEGSGVHPHESSPLMTVPMIILAIAAAAIGGVLSIGNAFTTWLQPSLGEVEHAHPVAPEIAIQVVTLLLVLAGAGLAWMMYGRREVPTAIPAGNALTRAARQDLYQDSVNEALFMTPGIALVKAATLGDDKAIDGIVHVVEKASTGAGRAVGATQSGRVRTYASYILGGVVLALAAVLAFTL